MSAGCGVSAQHVYAPSASVSPRLRICVACTCSVLHSFMPSSCSVALYSCFRITYILLIFSVSCIRISLLHACYLRCWRKANAKCSDLALSDLQLPEPAPFGAASLGRAKLVPISGHQKRYHHDVYNHTEGGVQVGRRTHQHRHVTVNHRAHTHLSSEPSEVGWNYTVESTIYTSGRARSCQGTNEPATTG